MHQIYLVNSCNFMFVGFKELMRSVSPQITVSLINNPKDIPKEYESGNQLIIIYSPVSEPRVAAKAAIWLRQFEYIQLSEEQLLLPCVLLSDKISSQYKTLPEKTPLTVLCNSLLHILNKPEAGQRKLPVKDTWKPITPLQKKILSDLLDGKTINEIARKLNIKPRTVFYNRNTLVGKLGLKNRFMLLTISENNIN